MVDVRNLGGFFNILVGGVLVAVLEILGDSAGEKPGVLQDHTEQSADLGTTQLVDWRVVDSDVTGIWFVEAHQKIDNCSFAGAGWANDGDLLARQNLGGEIFNDWTFFVVAKVDVMELDGTFDFFNRLLGFIGWFCSLGCFGSSGFGFSNRCIVLRETPASTASSFWVKPCLLRSIAIFFEMFKYTTSFKEYSRMLRTSTNDVF